MSPENPERTAEPIEAVYLERRDYTPPLCDECEELPPLVTLLAWLPRLGRAEHLGDYCLDCATEIETRQGTP